MDLAMDAKSDPEQIKRDYRSLGVIMSLGEVRIGLDHVLINPLVKTQVGADPSWR